MANWKAPKRNKIYKGKRYRVYHRQGKIKYMDKAEAQKKLSYLKKAGMTANIHKVTNKPRLSYVLYFAY